MKNYKAPKAEIQSFTCEDIMDITYSANGDGNKVSWDVFEAPSNDE